MKDHSDHKETTHCYPKLNNVFRKLHNNEKQNVGLLIEKKIIVYLNRAALLQISSKIGNVSVITGMRDEWVLYGILRTRLKALRHATQILSISPELNPHNSHPYKLLQYALNNFNFTDMST